MCLELGIWGNMNSFLNRVMGPYRAELLRYYVSQYTILTLFGILALAGFLALFLWLNPEKHRHDGFLTAKVTGILHTSSDTSNRFIVDVELQDGSTHRLSTKRGAILGALSEHACLERRRKETSGRVFYKLAPAWKCEGHLEHWSNCLHLSASDEPHGNAAIHRHHCSGDKTRLL